MISKGDRVQVNEKARDFSDENYIGCVGTVELYDPGSGLVRVALDEPPKGHPGILGGIARFYASSLSPLDTAKVRERRSLR